MVGEVGDPATIQDAQPAYSNLLGLLTTIDRHLQDFTLGITDLVTVVSHASPAIRIVRGR
jgi:hypothetical protein